MKRGWVLAIIAANLLGLAVLAFAYPHLMIAPGALMPEHAALTTDCFACHAPLHGVTAARCETCHKLSEIGKVTTTGVTRVDRNKTAFHQQLTEQNCMACHSDHEGPKLTGHSRKSFSHALLKPEIRSKCETCHQPPATAVHRDLKIGCSQCHQAETWKGAKFDHALLGAEQKARCETCHQPPGDSFHAQITGNCQQCHSPAGWKPANFDHAKFFLLQPPHNTACATCHVNNDTRRYTCFGCHEHQPDRIRAEHAEEGIRNIEHCASCHRGAGEDGERGERERD